MKHNLKTKVQPSQAPMLGRFGRKVAGAKGAVPVVGRKGAGGKGRQSVVAAGKGGGKGGGKSSGQQSGQWVFVPQGALAPSGKKGGGKGKRGVVQPQFLKQLALPQGPSAKHQLAQALQLLLCRSCTKDDCVYEMTEERGKQIATVTIADLPTERKEFKGKPSNDEREAQMNAAQKVLNCLSKEIQTAREERDAVRAEKTKAKKEAGKEKREARMAAKEADSA